MKRRVTQTSSVPAADYQPQRVSMHINSLAVLPLKNATGDPELEYLSDGITGSLINTLASIPKLRVMAQSTIFRYKGQEIDPQAIGRELHVRAVVTGRIMQGGGSLRVGTELVDVATGCQLWGAQYDRTPDDILVVQDEISSEISTSGTPHRESRGVPAVSKRSPSLEQVDRGSVLQGHRVLSTRR